MAILKSADIAALQTAIVANFAAGVKNAAATHEQIATKIPSTAAQNAYAWLDSFPQFREWLSDRQIESIKEQAYVLPNKKFEATLGIQRTDVEDDNVGHYGTLGKSYGDEAVKFYNRHIFNALKAGSSTLCYDGQNFFDTDHPVYPNTDGTGAAITVSNCITGTADSWYLLDVSGVIKPLILQERVAPNMEAITSSQNDSVVMKDQYLMAARARAAFGYGFWQMAVQSQQPLSQTSFNEAFALMQSRTGNGGDPLGLTPSLLVVPPALRAAANELINIDRLDNGKGNPNYKAVAVLATPWLAA